MGPIDIASHNLDAEEKMTQVSDDASALMENLAIDGLQRLQQRDFDAYVLATLASFATRIEPSLLRALRITYSGHRKISPYARLTVSSESRLWFSDIVASRSSNAISLLPRCAHQLRQALFKHSPDLCELIRESILAHHRELPQELRFIEALNYLSGLWKVDGKDGEFRKSLIEATKLLGINQSISTTWVRQHLSSLPTEFLPYCVQVLKSQNFRPTSGITWTNSARLNKGLEAAATATAASVIADNSASDDNLETPHVARKKDQFWQNVTSPSGASWIRNLALANDHSKELLHDADALAMDLFKRASESGFRFYDRFKPFLTIADDSGSFIYPHAEAIEDKLDELIRGVRIVDKDVAGEPQEEKPRSFKPTKMEAMYLCAAARLRAIGLLHGLFTNERTQRPSENSDALLFDCTMPTSPPFERKDKTVDLEAVIKILESFPSRSSRFIISEWNFCCRWTKQEKAILSSLLQSYSPNVPWESIPETMVDIRVRELACLLRVATASMLVNGVCPLELRMQFKPGGVWEPRKTNLATMDWIADSFFDRGRSQLVIQAIVPPRIDIPDPRKQPRSLPVASVDYGHSVQFLGTIVQDVLDSVEPVLGKYPNTTIRSVEVQQSRAALVEDEPDRDLPNNWLLPLASAMDGAEVAGTAATVLRSFCTYGLEGSGTPKVSFKDEVEQVCRVVETMHRFNALALRLVHEIRTEFDWSKEPNEQQIKSFGDRMEQVMIERAHHGDQTADQAISQDVLKNADGTEVDIVVVTHYGRCVISTLIRSAFKGEVWLVEPAPDTHGRWVPDSSDRIEKVLQAANIRVRRVEAGNLFVLLSGLRGKKSTAYLTGTKGMWASNSGGEVDRFVCSVGVWNALTTVKRFKGRAVIMSEKDKTFLETTGDREPIGTTVENKLQAVQQEADRKPWAQVEIVEKELFDMVVTFGKPQ